ncbi:biotin--[acetyl-CoA-carboxylase] ligase [Sinorhizobium americanum]|uniref:biotin--[biotin carboxyl-carrier protein] ligase n=1 Tax=Sinorhizobium americanum TaxID=194963 RepID=A0A1L3LKU0_9HYPH|nr:biotin--[acetyl-CoA-carboxylase] ligase [Sinorhizobium americanum]APG90701.1 biotin transcriptional regulator bifunctional protein BirA [Sinorhizobium americanum]OAP48352.1 biotin biosynthesis protein [Sinorhizobium americanum]TCN28238.1 BirA family biotin operon repressor/biotin-[acetyl-CoA-carboxylase] ligase [Sinorhizobium americanum]
MTGGQGSGRISPDDFRHIALAETVSTNSECLARAREGDPGNLWITAARQTGGRGRRGREWFSEPGNLYASLLLVDPAPVKHLHSLPLAAAVAVHRAIRRVMPPGSPEVAIKWPNDILIDGRKTCGILLEGEALPDGRHALVIGCGVNVAVMPATGLYPVTSLRQEGATISADELFAHLFVTMAEALSTWDRGAGIAAIIDQWKAAAKGIGEAITVNLPDRSLSGRFVGIDEDGRLLLDTGSGAPLAIAAGDVFLG